MEIVIISLASQEYQERIGFIPYGTKIDIKKIETGLAHPQIRNLLFSRVLLIGEICEKYDLKTPFRVMKTSENKMLFREWFAKMTKEYNLETRMNPDVLGRSDFISACTDRLVEKYRRLKRRRHAKSLKSLIK